MARILVIDDDESVRTALKIMLSANSCDVVLADSARLGARIFKSDHFDIVIVDIFMPGVDGLEAIKDFRRRAPTIPIIAMSGFRFHSSRVNIPAPDFLGMAMQSGATLCLRKPFDPVELMEAIARCIGARTQDDQTTSHLCPEAVSRTAG